MNIQNHVWKKISTRQEDWDSDIFDLDTSECIHCGMIWVENVPPDVFYLDNQLISRDLFNLPNCNICR